jgi:hypothetical protein
MTIAGKRQQLAVKSTMYRLTKPLQRISLDTQDNFAVLEQNWTAIL